MFLTSYELVVVFFDVRVPLRTMVHAARHYGVPVTGEIIVLLGVGACLLAIACLLAVRIGKGQFDIGRKIPDGNRGDPQRYAGHRDA
jgi:hypothetical protein